MPPVTLSIYEHGLIYRAGTNMHFSSETDELALEEPLFIALRTLAGMPEAENILTYTYRRGQETIKVGAYAGIIGLPGRAMLEILPKIDAPQHAPCGQAKPARTALLRMLHHLRDSPFRTLTDAHLQATQLPIWTVFVQAFLDALTTLTRQGLQMAYQPIEANDTMMRGRLQLGRQLRQNLFHAERMAVTYDAQTLNVPANRVLKSALLHVLPRVGTLQLETRLYQLLTILHDIPPSDNILTDIAAIQSLNRTFDRYKPALRWAELLLTGRAFGPRTGQTSALSLLFPMEQVFESYVSHGFQAFWPTGDVRTQESTAHLVDEHGGAPKFKLRPDILVRESGRTLVLDTKWKVINGQNRSGQYGIESSDLYQLFAYGKKYNAGDVFLIYPANPSFRQPLDVFGYDPAMRLHVVPFDVTRPLREEVEKVGQYIQ